MQKEPSVSELLQQGFSKTFKKRFWSKVNKEGPVQPHCPELGKCWGWFGHITRYGYGTIRQGANDMPHIFAHRASWVLHFGPIPDGLFVLHKCDNPPCSNPAHLFLGGHLENARDKMQKGRFVALRGEDHGMSKLTWDEVDDIRSFYVRGKRGRGYKSIAKKYGMALSVIAGIVNGHNWKNSLR